MTTTMEELPEYQFVVIDPNNQIIHGMKINSMKSDYEIALINKIETGLNDM